MLFQVHKSLQRIREKRLINFIDWGPANIQVVVSKKSPYIKTSHRVSGMMLANNTCIRHLFKSCLNQYDKLMRRKAFLDQYEKYDIFQENFAEFQESKEMVESLIHEYEKCQEKKIVGSIN